jgi:hypothetical protein
MVFAPTGAVALFHCGTAPHQNFVPASSVCVCDVSVCQCVCECECTWVNSQVRGSVVRLPTLVLGLGCLVTLLGSVNIVPWERVSIARFVPRCSFSSGPRRVWCGKRRP